MNLFLRTMFKLSARPGLRRTFLWPLSRRILFETTQILEPFWFLFLGRELYQVTAFYHLLDDLAAQVGPEKMHVLAECRVKQVLRNQHWAGRRWVRTFKRRFGISGRRLPLDAHCLEEVVFLTYWYVSIRSSFWQAVAAAALGWAALGSHLQTKIWHFGQAFAT